MVGCAVCGVRAALAVFRGAPAARGPSGVVVRRRALDLFCDGVVWFAVIATAIGASQLAAAIVHH